MKSLSDYLKNKNVQRNQVLDEKTVFFVFEKVLRREYGDRGMKNIEAQCYRERALHIRAKSSIWANEIWLNREELVKLFNQEIGSDEIREIKVKH